MRRHVCVEKAVLTCLESAFQQSFDHSVCPACIINNLRCILRVLLRSTSFRFVHRRDVSLLWCCFHSGFVLFKKYGGSEEDHLAYWILQFLNAIDLMDITDEKRRVIFAVANLKGEARDWYFNCKILNPDAFSTFDTFVTELKAHFNPPWYDFMILRKAMNTKQGSLSIRDYSIEMRSLFARQPDPNRYFDSTRVAIFFNGLNHGPARDAIEQRTSETYEKAVKIALEIDYRCRSHHSNTSSDSRPRDSKPGRRNADDDQF
ncbi:hypothetical protein Ae201684P_015499 [Aphanomyces euteiches]|nr:hypothetical protein Ae201684P_015499 [Aphanomyces euteiches]